MYAQHICIYIYIHTHICIYIERERERDRFCPSRCPFPCEHVYYCMHTMTHVYTYNRCIDVALRDVHVADAIVCVRLHACMSTTICYGLENGTLR